jgi:hypothetical protein
MATKKVEIGSVIKGRDGKPDYISIRGDHVLKDNDKLRLESKAMQLADLEKAVAAGKLSAEIGDKIREGINKTPDFVRFKICKFENK